MSTQFVRLPDGTLVEAQVLTKTEAADIKRLPQVKAALGKITEGNTELVDWLVTNQEGIESAFETGTIHRVTKSERNKLEKALAALTEATDFVNDNSKVKFLVENSSAILESFRWPAVKRMDTEEKETAARNTLTKLTEGDKALSDWIFTNQQSLIAAYGAGVEKRAVNPKAADALAAYRAKMKAEKEAKAAA